MTLSFNYIINIYNYKDIKSLKHISYYVKKVTSSKLNHCEAKFSI